MALKSSTRGLLRTSKRIKKGITPSPSRKLQAEHLKTVRKVLGRKAAVKVRLKQAALTPKQSMTKSILRSKGY